VSVSLQAVHAFGNKDGQEQNEKSMKQEVQRSFRQKGENQNLVNEQDGNKE